MLTTKIKALQLQARKDRNQIATNLFTTLLGELNTIEVNTRAAVPDSQTIKVVQKFIKNNDFTLVELGKVEEESAKLDGEVFKLAQENYLLKSLLPQQLSAEDIFNLIKQQWPEDSTPPAMPDIMKFLKENYACQYDGKVASTIAKDFVTNL